MQNSTVNSLSKSAYKPTYYLGDLKEAYKSSRFKLVGVLLLVALFGAPILFMLNGDSLSNLTSTWLKLYEDIFEGNIDFHFNIKFLEILLGLLSVVAVLPILGVLLSVFALNSLWIKNDMKMGMFVKITPLALLASFLFPQLFAILILLAVYCVVLALFAWCVNKAHKNPQFPYKLFRFSAILLAVTGIPALFILGLGVAVGIVGSLAILVIAAGIYYVASVIDGRFKPSKLTAKIFCFFNGLLAGLFAGITLFLIVYMTMNGFAAFGLKMLQNFAIIFATGMCAASFALAFPVVKDVMPRPGA